MDNINKTSLEEAKNEYGEIKKFAKEAALKQLEEQLDKDIDKIINDAIIKEDVTITISTDNKEEIKDIDVDGEKIDIEKEKIPAAEEDGEEIAVEPDEEIEEELKVIENIDTMEENKFMEEQNPEANAPAQTPEAPETTPQETPEVPATEAPAAEGENIDPAIMDLAKSLSNAIKSAMASEGGNSSDQSMEVIDDEKASEQPAPGAEPAQTPEAPQGQPVQEEETMLEFDLDEMGIGKKDEAIYEIEAEPKEEEKTFEINEDELTEMLGQSYSVTGIHGSKKHYSEPGEDYRTSRKVTKESIENKIKTQNESNTDELKKENKRLNESMKEMKGIISDYEKSFIELRQQFDEMQTFNAKLAYVNKLFESGGLTTDQKIKLSEDFDKAETADEAKKLYESIVKNSGVIINKNNVQKIKPTATNTGSAAQQKNQPKQPIYESAAMSRQKVLAGITKPSEE